MKLKEYPLFNAYVAGSSGLSLERFAKADADLLCHPNVADLAEKELKGTGMPEDAIWEHARTFADIDRYDQMCPVSWLAAGEYV